MDNDKTQARPPEYGGATGSDFIPAQTAALELVDECTDHPEFLDDAAIEQRAFEAFAFLYPHEAHAQDQDRFWTFFHEQCPEKSRDDMLRILAETSQNLPLGCAS